MSMTAASVMDPEVFLAVEDLELVGRGLAPHSMNSATPSGALPTRVDTHSFTA